MVLLVVDVQKGITDERLYDFDAFKTNIKRVIDDARKNCIEVIYVRHDDGPGSGFSAGDEDFEIFDGIAPHDGEKIFDKKVNSALNPGTGLLDYLKNKHVRTLIITGLQTDYCIDATVKSSFDNGFEVIVPQGCNSTRDNPYMDAETTYKFFNESMWPGRYAQCISVEETISRMKGYTPGETKADKERIRKFYEENMYGIWRDGETVSYRLLGEDPKKEAETPFEAVGGELVEINIENGIARTSFVIHAYIPKDAERAQFPKGSPFIVCMHPIRPLVYFLTHGYALLVMDCKQIATDDTRHEGAFYDLYPYGSQETGQTGVLMAWAWGASKTLDAVRAGLYEDLHLDPEASMVTGVSRYGKASAVCGAFDERFRMTIPTCSGAGGLALYSVVSEGKTYDLSSIGGPSDYRFDKNEPLDCLQSDSERGWFNDRFLQYKTASDIPIDQENLPILAMDEKRYYFIIASYMGEDWVNSPAMWECYLRANEEYEKNGLSDHLAVHFHKEGHAVIQEDAELIVRYFNSMYYGTDSGLVMQELKTTAFNGQEGGV